MKRNLFRKTNNSSTKETILIYQKKKEILLPLCTLGIDDWRLSIMGLWWRYCPCNSWFLFAFSIIIFFLIIVYIATDIISSQARRGNKNWCSCDLLLTTLLSFMFCSLHYRFLQVQKVFIYLYMCACVCVFFACHYWFERIIMSLFLSLC